MDEIIEYRKLTEMKNQKEIQIKIDELQKGVDTLENLLIKTEDAKVRESYMQTREDVQ